MEMRKSCETAMRVMTGASHSRDVRIRTAPMTPIIRIHNRKEPSCPAQNDETKKCVGSAEDVC